MHEFHLTSSSNKEEFRKYCDAMKQHGALLLSAADYQQLQYPLDQMYIDYNWQGKLVTLHYEHTLGVYLLSKELPSEDLEKIARFLH